MKPLRGMRGIRNVAIVGCVSDEWAEYLQSPIKSAPGTATPSFDYSEGSSRIGQGRARSN